MRESVAVYYSVLQCSAGCCSAVLGVAVQYVAVCSSVQQGVAECCSVVLHTATAPDGETRTLVSTPV